MGKLVDEKACALSPEAQAQLTVLNKWYAGPVMLAEVNARAKHVTGCPLASFM